MRSGCCFVPKKAATLVSTLEELGKMFEVDDGFIVTPVLTVALEVGKTFEVPEGLGVTAALVDREPVLTLLAEKKGGALEEID